MDQLLIVFIRRRMADRTDVDLGELFDAAEQYFKTKVESRGFLDCRPMVLRVRPGRRRKRLAAAQ